MEQYSSSAATTSSSSPSSQRGGARELQGPRPAPLKVRKDSHKIRKPPPQQEQQVRQPVIIYTVSPKVVHAEPSEFMSVVQRLTGARHTHTHTAPSSSSSVPAAAPHQTQTTSSSLPFPFFGVSHQQHAPSSSSALLPPPPAPHSPFQLQQQAGGAGPQELTQLSPAARLAAIEQAASARSAGGAGEGLLPPFPSILSPGSLPAIQPSFFSPPAGAGTLGGGGINLFGDLISPAAFLGASASASGNISSAAAAAHHTGAISQNLMLQQAEASPSSASPSAGAYYWDLFNNQHYHRN
ncbi:hypothetical protein BAE44_0016384 [Dichanthelium oligosanthes]|uniref:VQ domain-containing protein n=1 Tax=Dichanthelium oligosanthes TaxID=888268 RepID=A0A1E5VC02_9POAL|nr:hypothetical protein BAE44_0016384 [Dichanthelium oligosanthes]